MIYKIGSKGDKIKEIQIVLNLYPDGIFGKLTEEAVMTYQRENGLKVDGIVGEETYRKLFTNGFTKSKRKITDIVVHCTASRCDENLTVADIRKIHKKNGWSDIGYHYVVRLDGIIELGRNVNISGAHVSGHNPHSIGIVYVGGLDKNGRATDTRTEAQKKSLIDLLKALKKYYPSAKISGHRDFSPDLNHNGIIEPKEWIKQCPCFDAKTEYSSL